MIKDKRNGTKDHILETKALVFFQKVLLRNKNKAGGDETQEVGQPRKMSFRFLRQHMRQKLPTED